MVILDLEDAVAEGAKAAARTHVVRWLSEGGIGCVRVNAVTSDHHHDDIEALSDVAGLCSVMVPKADVTVDWAGIERSVRGTLDGQLKLDWETGGLRAGVTMSLADLAR